MLEDLIDRYCRAIGCLIAAMMAVMVVLVFGNVLIRRALNSGFTLAEELSRAAVATNLELSKNGGMTVTQFSPDELANLREQAGVRP